MNGSKLTSTLALLPLLAGCATTSFAPPRINNSTVLTDDGKCNGTGSDSIAADTAAGARKLIDNYFVAYDCATRELANGRQAFEIPSALALAGGAAAAAFGAGPNVAIATGAGSALFSRGNGYYAPKAKAHMVSAGLSAVNCIKQEAIGATALNVTAGEKVAKDLKARLGIARAGDPALEFSPEAQYYQMVGAALRDIHAVLGERLGSIGSYSPDALASDIVDLAKKKTAAESQPTRDAAAQTASGMGLTDGEKPAVVNAMVELAKLQPQLKLCVIRAKAG